MTAEQFLQGFLGASSVEVIASVAGFICVFLIIRRSIWNFFFGLIQVSLFTWVFYQAKLYSDTFLHVFYIGLQFYGWWNWRQHRGVEQPLVIQQTSGRDLIIWSSICLIAAAAVGTLMHNYTDASFAYADAFTTCTSLVAQFLMTRRHLLNWVFWMVVDGVAIWIYLQKGLYPTSLLYLVFLIMCCFGQYYWWKDLRLQQSEKSKEATWTSA